jgi:hypothetical protein
MAIFGRQADRQSAPSSDSTPAYKGRQISRRTLLKWGAGGLALAAGGGVLYRAGNSVFGGYEESSGVVIADGHRGDDGRLGVSENSNQTNYPLVPGSDYRNDDVLAEQDPLDPVLQRYVDIIEEKYQALVRPFFEDAGIDVPDEISPIISMKDRDTIKIGYKSLDVSQFENQGHDNVAHDIVHNVVTGNFAGNLILIDQPFAEVYPSYFGEMSAAYEKGVQPSAFKFSDSGSVNATFFNDNYDRLKSGNNINWFDLHTPAGVLIVALERDYGTDYGKMQQFAVDLRKTYRGKVDSGMNLSQAVLTPEEFEESAKRTFGQNVNYLFDLLGPGIERFRAGSK